MDTITLARELGRAIQQEESYINLKNVQAQADADAQLQDLIGQFNIKRLSINGAYTDYQNPENSLKLDISGTALEGLRLTYAYPLGNSFDVSTDNAMITGMTALKSLRSLTVYGCNTYDYDLTGCTKLKDLNIAGETDDYGYNSGDTFHSLDLTVDTLDH